MFTVALDLKGGGEKQQYRQQLLDSSTRLIFRTEALFTQVFHRRRRLLCQHPFTVKMLRSVIPKDD